MLVERGNTLDHLKDLETVKDLVYLGSQLSKDGDLEKEIMRRIPLVCTALTILANLCKQKEISCNINIRLCDLLHFRCFICMETQTTKAR